MYRVIGIAIILLLCTGSGALRGGNDGALDGFAASAQFLLAVYLLGISLTARNNRVQSSMNDFKYLAEGFKHLMTFGHNATFNQAKRDGATAALGALAVLATSIQMIWTVATI